MYKLIGTPGMFKPQYVFCFNGSVRLDNAKKKKIYILNIVKNFINAKILFKCFN